MKTLNNITVGSSVSILLNGMQEQVNVCYVSKTTVVISRLEKSNNPELKHMHDISFTNENGEYVGLYEQKINFTKKGNIAHWHQACGNNGKIVSVDILN